MPFNKSPWDEEYARPEPKRETKTFTHGSFELTVTMEGLDAFNLGHVRDKAEALVAKYVTGEGKKPPQPVLVPGRPPRKVMLSRDLCGRIGMLQALERPAAGNGWPEGQGPISVSDWLGVLANHEPVWDAVFDWIDTLGVPVGNASTEDTPATTTD